MWLVLKPYTRRPERTVISNWAAPRPHQRDNADMSEADAIARSDRPATVESLTREIRALGLGAGDTVMVHSSLSRLGFVCGGAEAVVLALLDVVGPTGTVAMPTHSGGRSDPAPWRSPPVPESWWEPIRASMPAFDPMVTPTRMMGAVVECFRHVPGFRRSYHPSVSVGAVGPNAATITADHELGYGMGDGSPLARLYDLDAHVLLLGVGHGNNTSLHLAEYRTPEPTVATVTRSAPVRIDGVRQWVTYDDLDNDEEDFETIGEAFAATGLEESGPVGVGTGRFMRQRALVDFAVTWMTDHRTFAAPGPSAQQ